MGEDKKISLVETILLVLFVGMADIIEIILVCFALDDFWLSDIITGGAVGFYFLIKGAKGEWILGGWIAEAIPYIGALPIKSIALWIAIYITNHPKIAKVAQVVQVTGGKIAPAKPTMPTSPASK